METTEVIVVASVAIPFIVEAFKSVLKAFDWEVRPQILVMAVCSGIGLVYACVNSFLPEDMLATFAEIAGITYVTSQSLYKFHTLKGRNEQDLR